MLSYEVMAITAESDERIQFFVDYYLRNGASKITLFCDGKLPQRSFDRRVSIVECNEKFWAYKENGRPNSVEDRQRSVYELAYKECLAKWLLVVDTDEFIVGFDLIEKSTRRTSAPAVRVASAEAIFSVQDQQNQEFSAKHFRIPQNKYFAQILPRIFYPKYGHLFIRGLLGHSVGKQFIRAGMSDIQIGIHSIFRNNVAVRPLEIVNYAANDGVFLCHFDAISYPQWKEKWERRLKNGDTAEMGAKRDRQMEVYLRTSSLGEAAIHDLFCDLYGISPYKLQMMKVMGLAFSFDRFG